MSRLTRLTLLLLGSLSLAAGLVNWADHYSWISRFHEQPLGAMAGLVFVGWLLRRGRLGRPGEAAAGLFLALLARMALHPLLPSEPQDHEAVKLAWVAAAQAALTLGAYLSLEAWSGAFERCLKAVPAPLRVLLGGALAFLPLLGGGMELFKPYAVVYLLAYMAAVSRVNFLGVPARTLTLAAWTFAAWFLVQDGGTGMDGEAVRMGTALLAPAALALMGLFWERWSAKPAWLAVLFVLGLLGPNMMGRSGVDDVSLGVLAVGAAWGLWWLWSRLERGETADLPAWLADLREPFRWILDGLVGLALLAASKENGDPLGAGLLLGRLEDHAFWLLPLGLAWLRSRRWSAPRDWGRDFGLVWLCLVLGGILRPGGAGNLMIAVAAALLLLWRALHPAALPAAVSRFQTAAWPRYLALAGLLAAAGFLGTGNAVVRQFLGALLAGALLRGLLLGRPASLRLGATWLFATGLLGVTCAHVAGLGTGAGGWLVLAPVLTYALWESLGTSQRSLAAVLLVPLTALAWLLLFHTGGEAFARFFGAQTAMVVLSLGLRYAVRHWEAWTGKDWARKLRARMERLNAWLARFKPRPAPASVRPADGPSGFAAELAAVRRTLAEAWGLVRTNPKRSGRIVGALALAAALLGGVSWWRHSSALVSSFTPEGEVASPNTVIQVRFSKPVFAKVEDLGGSITVDPPLAGTVRLADERTLVFHPSQPLAPSTAYSARLDTAKLGTRAFRLQGSAVTRFSTPRFAVGNLRLYYNYDLLHQNETELVGEVDFNEPVAEDRFRAALRVRRDGKDQGFTVEKGLLASRYLFRVGGLHRLEKAQEYGVRIDKSLACDGCALGLAADYEQAITLDPQERFRVEGVELHHEAGRSLVAVQFNLPVTQEEARRQIRLERVFDSGASAPQALKVESEYAYAVLTSDFQPNRSYRVTIGNGIRSRDGRLIEAPLGKKDPATGQPRRLDIVRDISIEDAPAALEFSDAGHYLPRGGSKVLGVKTTNLDDFRLTAYRVYKNNLVHYLRDDGAGGGEDWRYGRPLYDGTVKVEGGEINAAVTTRLDLAQRFGGRLDGLYNIGLNNEGHGLYAGTWLLATDLGLSATRAGKDLWVQVLSVSTLAPRAGVLVEIYSRENQVLRSARTDADGRARFEGYDAEMDGLNPFLLVASDGDDLSFMHLNRSPLSVSRFDTGGDPSKADGFEAFLSSDRGLYRPGDALNLTGILRRQDLGPAGVPVELRIMDSQWNEFKREALVPDDEGLFSYHLDLKAGLATGDYQAQLRVKGKPELLAQCGFKVEEFIPNKIKAEIELAKKEAEAGGKIEYTVRAAQLFGAPAAGLNVQTQVSLSPGRFEAPGYAGYHFADDSRSFNSEVLRVPKGVTDAKGSYPVSLDIPTSVLPASMIVGNVYAEVMDEGGRPVGANAVVRIHRYGYYLGLKSRAAGAVSPGQKVDLSLVALRPDGRKLKVEKVPVVITRRRWYSLFRRNGWRSGYESSYYDEVVDARSLTVDGEASLSFTADQEGDYTVLAGGESGMRCSLKVAVQGSGGTPGDLQDPGTLKLRLDKDRYTPGETARVTVDAPFAGRLLLSLEREGVFEQRSLAVPAGRSEAEIPVGPRAQPNAYVVGLLVRRPEESLREFPMLSFGVAALAMDNRNQRLDLSWPAPAKVGSKDGLEVDLATGEPGAEVVVAAVDEGILQIVNFETPDPFKFFYRKRRLETQRLTFFDEILPDLARKEAPGGDEDMAMERRHLNPVAAKRVKSFARYSGILKADAAGHVRVKFETGDFQGEARVMALAVKGRRFGAEAYHVKVADDLVLQPQLPRFLAPGDLVQMPVTVFNQTEQEQTVALSVELEGPLSLGGKAERSLVLGPKAQAGADFDLGARMDAGVAAVAVTGRLNDGRRFTRRLELGVRPGQPLTTELRRGRLKPGEDVGLDVPGDFIPFGRKARVHVSANPLYEFIGAFSSLVRYPYGCAEQMTSQGFALLALKGTGLLGSAYNLAAGRGGDAEADKDIQAAVRELQKMENGEGAFKLWPNDDTDRPYLSDYVAQFLFEAERAGFQVDRGLLQRVRARVGAIHVAKNAGRLDRSEDNVAERPILDPYRLYLRALAGEPDRDAMRALLGSKERLDGLSVFDRSLLSLAFAETGDQASAQRALPAADVALKARQYRESGACWCSTQRDLAGFLMAQAQSGASVEAMEPVMDEMRRRMKDGHFGTTHEDAWSFLALSRALKRWSADRPMKAEWRLDKGLSHALEGERSFLGDKDDLFGHRLTVGNRGEGKLAYFVLAEGTRLSGTAGSESSGMSIRRVYRDENGRELALGNVVQGQLVVVTLEVDCKRPTEHLVVVDLLPAGFEVDNPRLKSRGRLGFDPPAQVDLASADFRDDRVLLFTASAQGTLRFSYSVRAVTPGTFHVPALLAEAMYDPEIHGRSDPGTELVIAPNKF